MLPCSSLQPINHSLACVLDASLKCHHSQDWHFPGGPRIIKVSKHLVQVGTVTSICRRHKSRVRRHDQIGYCWPNSITGMNEVSGEPCLCS
uniref:Uncharacterized protein n=1 Tax=Anguilla anguilla TaxID=7936 RepID=A0A0E9STB7_ANGAN